MRGEQGFGFRGLDKRLPGRTDFIRASIEHGSTTELTNKPLFIRQRSGKESMPFKTTAVGGSTPYECHEPSVMPQIYLKQRFQ